MDPRYYGISKDHPATDQHPNHPVDAGDLLIKQVYEAVRGGPKWNSTLLLITYDEHGGWFDHVPPPSAPSPDGLNSTDDPFDFTRLGVRVPTIAVSPLIPKGTLVSKPGTGGTQAKEGSEFEATSLLSTMSQLFRLPSSFTKRDAWASSFAGVLSGSLPRTDCPTSLPSPPDHDEICRSAGQRILPEAGTQPLNDLQELFLESLSGLTGQSMDSNDIITEGNAGQWMLNQVADYICRETDGSSPLCSLNDFKITV